MSCTNLGFTKPLKIEKAHDKPVVIIMSTEVVHIEHILDTQFVFHTISLKGSEASECLYKQLWKPRESCLPVLAMLPNGAYSPYNSTTLERPHIWHFPFC